MQIAAVNYVIVRMAPDEGSRVRRNDTVSGKEGAEINAIAESRLSLARRSESRALRQCTPGMWERCSRSVGLLNVYPFTPVPAPCAP